MMIAISLQWFMPMKEGIKSCTHLIVARHPHSACSNVIKSSVENHYDQMIGLKMFRATRGSHKHTEVAGMPLLSDTDQYRLTNRLNSMTRITHILYRCIVQGNVLHIFGMEMEIAYINLYGYRMGFRHPRSEQVKGLAQGPNRSCERKPEFELPIIQFKIQSSIH